MSIYTELFDRVNQGETFHIDFEKRTMKVGKDFLVKNGEYGPERKLLGSMSINDVLQTIVDLYHEYKYSLPSERSESKRRKYFKALPIEELTDEQLVRAERREVAQSVLEGFILCAILTGQLRWDEEVMGKGWFYQRKSDPDLILLRSWIEKK